MTNSAPQQPKSSPPKSHSNVTYLRQRLRVVETRDSAPFRAMWTEELERRYQAVARWRGGDAALNETTLRK